MFVYRVNVMKIINESKLNQVLDFIKDFQIREGRSPSFRQIAKAVSFPSLETAQRYVKILHDRNLIERDNIGKIVIPTKLEAGKTITASLVGQVACGTPILAEENIEKTVQLPTAIFGNRRSMLLRAKGDSMIGVGINDGDIIVAEICNQADNGQIVVALIDDSATVKTFYKKKEHVILHPENPKYQDIITKDVVIQGIVRHVIHTY